MFLRASQRLQPASRDFIEDAIPQRAKVRIWILPMVAVAVILATLPVKWPIADFAEYWAAGRVLTAGGNPYDPAAILKEQVAIGWTDPKPIFMYNPPWTLPLTVPFAAFDFRLARALWLPTQLLITLWCAFRLWTLYGGSARHSTRIAGIALLWMPTSVAMNLGQMSPLILLGLVGFLWSLARGRDLAAGMCLSLTLVKPQLVALVWVAFGLWVLREKRWKPMAGVIVSLISASVTALWFDAAVFEQYRHLMTSAPPTLEFESPNIATIFRVVLQRDASWPQFIPTAAGVIAVAIMWFRRKHTWTWLAEMPGLVVLSCLLTSYGGWGFDLVVLLIPILSVFAALVRTRRVPLIVSGTATFAAISFAALAMHQARVPQAAFIWMTPAVALACRWLQTAARRSATPIPVPLAS